MLRLGAERVLLLEGADFQLRASHGFNLDHRWTEQVSLTILERCWKERSPLFLSDAQVEFEDRWSVAASDIRSVICLPWWSPDNQVAGLIYADVRARRGAFASHSRVTAQDCVRQIELALYGSATESQPAPSAPPPAPPRAKASLGLRSARRPASEPGKPTAPAASRPATRGGMDGRQVAIFYRSLATMVGAGLSLNRSLDVMARHAEGAGMRQVSVDLSEKICAGWTLSAAFQQFSQVFPRSDQQMVKAAEASGQLHRVLAELADFREKGYQLHLKVKQALTYPALVSLLSLAMILLGPPYLLQGQFQLIRDSGQTPPLLTQILMTVSDLLRQGGIPLLLAFVVGIFSAGRLLAARPAWQEAFWRKAMGVRGLSDFLAKLATARFAGCLGQTYRVGLPIQECLRLSAYSAENPVLLDRLPAVLEAMTNGAPLHASLLAANFFPAPFIHMVEAGEEAGKVDEMMTWVARLYEGEVEYALASLVTLIEPLLLMGMGILVGLILVATLQPMLGVLQGL
jgi:type II secretory pathway component PulF